MKLRVWHIPNIPGAPFHQEVSSIEEATLVLDTLARYDLYLGEMIDTNVQGLEVYEGGEWVEWHDDLDQDISEIRREGPRFVPPTAVRRWR